MIDEGYTKFQSQWRETAALEYAETEELIRWRRPLYAAGLIGQYADLGIGYGNLSLALDARGRFIISGTQTGHLEELSSEHFALVTAWDIGNNSVTSSGAVEPSSESMTHAAIYDLDAGIRAVVHTHSHELWVALNGRLPTTKDDVAYGTPQMAKEFERLFEVAGFRSDGVAVMAGHQDGLISIGQDLQEAAERILVLHQELVT